MFERSISRDEAISALASGEVIVSYPEDVPFPSCLMLATVNGRILHLVVAEERENRTCHVVTMYEPDPELWNPDFKTRRSP
jgi:Domain of unknown function (DUF4258)